jgi:hypothetical protein
MYFSENCCIENNRPRGENSPNLQSSRKRVTRLVEFLPMRWLFPFGSYFRQLAPTERLCINFDKNGLDYKLGNFSKTHLVQKPSLNQNLFSSYLINTSTFVHMRKTCQRWSNFRIENIFFLQNSSFQAIKARPKKCVIRSNRHDSDNKKPSVI